MSELRKYAILLTTAKAIQFTLYQVDGIDIEPAATFAAGDIKISKNGGAEVNTTNLPTDEGQGYRLILTAAELTASRIRLFIVDQTATKVWLDIEINIETFGNASAMFVTDFDEVMRGTDDAALASVATEARLSELDAANLPTDIAAILTDTGTSLPAALNAIAAYIDTEVAAILVDTGTTIPALIAALKNISIAEVNTEVDTALTDFFTSSDQLVIDFWNKVLSKSNFNVGQSGGKLLRELGAWNAAEGVVTGTPTTTSVTTNITGYDDDFFRDQGLWPYNGATMAGQSRIVTAYNGTTGVFTFDEPFTSALIAGDDVIVAAPHVHSVTEIKEAVRAEMDSNSTQLAAILTGTGTDLPATLATIASYIDTEIGTLIANLAIVDALVDAIKAKTDSFTFTKPGELDINLQSINDETITGDGSAAPFDVA